MNTIENNFKLYNLATIFLTGSNLWRGLLFLFYASIGLSLSQFGILAGITTATMLVFEIPTGIFADKYGRKNSLIISAVFCIITALLLFFSKSFALVAIAAFIYGLERCFRSGSNHALIYDSYLDLGRADEFKGFRSKNFTIEMSTMAIFSVIAGFLAQKNFQIVFAVSIIFSLLYFINLLFIVEPKSHNNQNIPLHYFKEGFKDIFRDSRLWYMMLYSLIIIGIVEGIYKFHQIYAQQAGFSLSSIGILFGVMFIVAAISSFFSIKIEKFLGYKLSLILIPILLGLVYITMGLVYSGIAVLFIFIESFIVGFNQPIITELNNKYISSEKRATILSIFSFAHTFMMTLIGVLIGYFSQKLGLNVIYVMLGIIILVAGLYTTTNLIKKTSV